MRLRTMGSTQSGLLSATATSSTSSISAYTRTCWRPIAPRPMTPTLTEPLSGLKQRISHVPRNVGHLFLVKAGMDRDGQNTLGGAFSHRAIRCVILVCVHRLAVQGYGVVDTNTDALLAQSLGN